MDSSSPGDDIDVSTERQRVLSGGADDDVMRIENLTKVGHFCLTVNTLLIRVCFLFVFESVKPNSNPFTIILFLSLSLTLLASFLIITLKF